MSEHRHEAHLPVPVGDVLDLLATRPMSWIDPFLHLAARAAGAVADVDGPGPWCRLGDGQPDGGGAVAVPVTWWPHLDHAFERFRGHWIVRRTPSGTSLALEGETRGGDPLQSDTALRSLLDFVVIALVERHRTS